MDVLNGADDALHAGLLSFMTSPVEHYGLIVAAASIALGLVLRMVRRAARA